MKLALPKGAEKFISKWKRRNCVEGILVTGSYTTSFFTENSDIDIYIVLSRGIKWRERGNVVVDNVLIEYFANPVEQILSYFKKEHEENERTTARMFAMGRIVYDRSGVVKELKEIARRWLRKKFKRMSAFEREIAKYCIWDMLDELKSVSKRGGFNYALTYANLLIFILRTYARALRTEVPPISKIDIYLKCERWRREYKFQEFPDKKFAEMFVSCARSYNLDEIEHLCFYVLDKLGGFDINGWKLRSRVDL
jgi:predicted nucleotidyltransferase